MARPGGRRPLHMVSASGDERVKADFGGQEALGRSTFGRTIAELSDRHSLRCTVRLDRRRSERPGAETSPVTRRIVVDRAVLEENDEEQAWIAAHEFGHLMDARAMGFRRYLPWGYFCLLPVAVATLGAPLLLVAHLQSVQQLPIAARLAIGVAALVMGMMALSVCALLALLCLGAHQRPLEDAADDFAKSQGYPLTPAIADMLEREERGKNGRPPNRRWRCFRRHRYPYERINVESDGGSGGTDWFSVNHDRQRERDSS